MTYAVDYSTDQYASKVLEKAIKTGGPDLLSQYLDAITKSSEIRRPRIPLIDIASDQYGNVSLYDVTNIVSHPIYTRQRFR